LPSGLYKDEGEVGLRLGPDVNEIAFPCDCVRSVAAEMANIAVEINVLPNLCDAMGA
jgi:hypothetical protein